MKVCRWLTARVAAAGVTWTAIVLNRVTAAVAETLGLALLRALTVTWFGVGRLSGAVYVVVFGLPAELVTVPTLWSPPTTPLTSQVTLGSCAPLTVAAKICERPNSTVAEGGDTATDIEPLMVTAMEAAFTGSAAGVAVMLTELGAGADAGAVYMPVPEIEPQPPPLHPGPETLQLRSRLGLELGAGRSAAVNWTLEPAFTAAGPLTATVKLLVRLTAAAALFEESAALCAVTKTSGGAGRIGGAINSPLGSIVPQAAAAQPGPATVQFTARFGFPEPVTLEVNCRVAPNSTSAVAGATLTATSLSTVTVAVACFDVSAWLVAWTLTEGCARRFSGAVYSPFREIVPTVVFPPAMPFTSQDTAVLLELLTVAVNCCVAPSITVAVKGERLTETDGGGGGGGGGPGLAPPPPQPIVPAPTARKAHRKKTERPEGSDPVS